MEVSNQALERYIHALNQRSIFGHYEIINDYKNEYPEEYRFLSSMSNKRSKIMHNIYFMLGYSKNVCFGALTFDNEHDLSSEENKRKQAVRHLNDNMHCWLLIEEYGEDNGRYHCHYIGILKAGITYKAFNESWHSYSFIEKVKSCRKTARYLSDYTSKQVPRLRRSKSLVEGVKLNDKIVRWTNLQFPSIAEEYQAKLGDLIKDWDLPF